MGKRLKSTREWVAAMNQFAVLYGDRFTGVVRAMSDPTIKNNVRRWQASVRRQPGGEEVANAIEDHLVAAKSSAPISAPID
jgi:hypothetical protein